MRGELKPAAGGLNQGHADFLFQQSDLLGYGRGAVGKGFGHGGKGLALMQFPQDPQPADIEHVGPFRQ